MSYSSTAHTPSLRNAATVGGAGERSSVIADFQEIARDIFEYRFLLFQLTLRDLKIRYKQAVMGFFWAIFMPALIVLAGLLVKYAMAYFSGRPLESVGIAALAVKALLWAFFVGAIGFASGSLVSNISLVTKIYFPREVLPLATTLAQGFDSTIGALAMSLVLPFLGITFSLQLAWVPLLLFLMFVFTYGLALLLSCANLFFRDVKYIVQVVLMFGIFFTPVFFEPSMFGPQGAQLLMLNPLAPYLEGVRLAVVEGHNLLLPFTEANAAGEAIRVWTPFYLLYGFVSAFTLVGIGAIVFHRLEFILAEYA